MSVYLIVLITLSWHKTRKVARKKPATYLIYAVLDSGMEFRMKYAAIQLVILVFSLNGRSKTVHQEISIVNLNK